MGDGVSLQTRLALQALDRDVYGPQGASPAPGAVMQTGLSARPLNAQDAMRTGDPKLLEFLRKRALAAQQAPPPPPPRTLSELSGRMGNGVPLNQLGYGSG